MLEKKVHFPSASVLLDFSSPVGCAGGGGVGELKAFESSGWSFSYEV